ncbi:hypothetical protein ACYPKM_05235 [Pseudomonas aeruginosa]
MHPFIKASFNNIEAIGREEKCSCYFCLRQFDSHQITEWTDGGTTAICPHCDIDAIVPGGQSMEDMKAAHVQAFTGPAK